MKRLLALSLSLASAGRHFWACLGDRSRPPTASGGQGTKLISRCLKRVLPAVVSIEAKPKAQLSAVRKPPAGQSPFDGIPGIPDEFRKYFEGLPKLPIPPQDSHPERATGSGFVVDPSGVILTNEHVVRGSDEVEVQFPDGRKFAARDIKLDAKTDLAVLRIDAKEPLPYLQFGDSTRWKSAIACWQSARRSAWRAA